MPLGQRRAGWWREGSRLDNRPSCRSLRFDLSRGCVVPLLGDGRVNLEVDLLGGDKLGMVTVRWIQCGSV